MGASQYFSSALLVLLQDGENPSRPTGRIEQSRAPGEFERDRWRFPRPNEHPVPFFSLKYCPNDPLAIHVSVDA
eukprot:7848442-Pyramimonas_sp.AAC.1